ncbi:MAG: transglutaminase-like cysteine peptidase [Hyphomicrobiales bacterium]|nr:transglutaminase-like cysteine peptidase [Hyphomicrobiales bacterium]
MPKKHGTTSGWLKSAAALAVLCLSAGAGQAQTSRQGAMTTGALPPVGSLDVSRSGDSRPPIGWVQFCSNRAYAAECVVDTGEPEKVELTPKLWRTVTGINSKVNKDIEPITDMDHWGVVERWDMAEDGKGDCEEYVNIKRKKLVDAGVPRRALRIVVVIDEENAGHAVLMLRTDKGDFILDNKRNAVLAWHQTGYIFVKRESQDKVGWVPLGGVSGTLVASN